MARNLLVSAAALVLAQPLWADEPASKTPLDELAMHLEAGQRDKAIAMVARVESLSGLPRIVTTPTAFVDRMLGCKMTEDKRRGIGTFTDHKTKWECEDGEYQIVIFTLPGKSFVEIAEFSDPARIADLAANPRPLRAPPAPPAPISREQMERNKAARRELDAKLCDALGTAMVSGTASGLAEFTNDQSRFSFAFHDPFSKAQFIEQDGEGLAAAQAWIDYTRQTLGAPQFFICETETSYPMLRLRFDSEDRTGFAFFGARGKFISSVDMRYATRERLLKAGEDAGVDISRLAVPPTAP